MFFKIVHLKNALQCTDYRARKTFNAYKKKLLEKGKKQFDYRYLPLDWFAAEYAKDNLVNEQEIKQRLQEAIKKTP
ncbi:MULTISPECIES: hypothetical protein [unclassified Breznakia]|uniref:hypothetical protein n=1 Tax=unclassified Breznakia TaxID=2623764 RepID=UPI002476231C|nr:MULTISPECIES: hypothetical protein [unclassified Breznakia]MDH6367522.1 hypothetical protein [Breznakia sp. PH1-1]MDH6404684.1 hypothetical protein [Breznakia sp. PF1-11]MDH6412352.1 hypothetical protein [Breznakia sp. PFB1-11]MDH6414690.1 hypothetical protein [Breznakia sp. PFB1-14]MDH6417065.1 hypothetical protein [Breznakia sp. PFB1-4]